MNNTFSQHWVSDEEKLEAFVLHKIDKEEFSNLTAHLEKCDECRKRVQEERELQAGIQKFGRMEMKRRLKIQLQRDRSRRFEWTHVASIAAAIVVVFSAVLTVRWFFDFEKDKTHVREIVFQESKPGEQAMWIIGKVIEVKYKSAPFAHSRIRNAPIDDDSYSGSEAGQKLIAKSDAEIAETLPSAVEESPAIISKEEAELHDTESSQAKGLMASKDLETRADVSSKTMRSAARVLNKKSDSYDSLDSERKQNPLLEEKDKLVSRIGYDSRGKQDSTPTTKGKTEMLKTVPVKVKTSHAMIAKRDLKDKNAPSILVRRGDMKDLPVSMRNADASVIHTRLERTTKGVLLTFYSTAITDTLASDIETIAPDSIIVSFRHQQIVYHIPGGLAGKM